MEIKFVWIQDYKNIKEIGFNFNNSNGEQFQYDGKNLSINVKEDRPPNEFFGKNISSVTAIVGKNGAGKTNLSEFLYYNLVHVRNGSMGRFLTGKGILVLDKKIFIQETLNLENEKQLVEKGYIIEKYRFNPLDNKGNRDWSQMEANRYVYYNPLLDMRFKDWDNGSDNIQDISTTYLLLSDIYNSSKHYNSAQFDRTKKKTDKILAFSRNEKIRESDVILFQPKIFEFLPKNSDEFQLSVDSVRNNQLLNLDFFKKEESLKDKNKAKSNDIYLLLRDLELDIQNDLQRYRQEEDHFYTFSVPFEVKKELFKKIFYINFFRAYWRIHATTISTKCITTFFEKGIFEIEKKSINNKLQSIQNDLNKILMESTFLVEKNIVYKDDEYREDSFDAIFNYIHLSFSKYHKELKRIIKNIKNLLDDNLHIHYQFTNNYSSGEQKLLNFYSRLYYAENEIKYKEKRNYNIQSKRIVLFIDEGEVGMHPEWQRLYFSKAIEFISRLFSKYEVQIIFTTHSPFILSELPNCNVIFLDKNDLGYTELIQDKTNNTFGGNIYSLFADSFFMANGTIGAFSRRKVEWVINLLESEKDLTPEDYSSVDFIISKIGEPIIKSELEELFKVKKEAPDLIALKDKINELEEQLKKLKNDSVK